MNEKLLDQNVEEKTTEEVVVDVSDAFPEGFTIGDIWGGN